MKHKGFSPKLLHRMIAVMLVMLFLVGCRIVTVTPVSEAPSAIATPQQSTVTLSPEQSSLTPTPTSMPTATASTTPTMTSSLTPTSTPIPPTETASPTNTPLPTFTPTAITAQTNTPTSAFFSPQPGATLTGDLKSSEATGSVTITLKVSEDGASVTEFNLTVREGDPLASLKCSNDLTLRIEGGISFSGPFPITEGKLDIPLAEEGGLKGQFISPSEAQGTLDFVMEIPGILGQPAYTCDFGIWEWSAKAKE